ncbi:MAG TPA: serine hydrolase domain-containing protein [Solirubrobacterales bacterium]|nr:serine hydrolase domain-containing protein [Solirubrobacterales bacterium]
MRKSLVSAAVLVVLSTCFAAPAAGGTTSDRAFRTSLDQLMKAQNGPPGVTVQITTDGRSRYYSRGLGDVAAGTGPRLRDHARIASVAKAFNGGIALSLVAEGELKLSDTIGEILPGLLPKARRVTLAQMLHHTGGLPDYIKDKRFIKVLQTDPGQFLTPRKLVSFVRHKKLTARPGKKYEYSDTDNIVVGLMAERATGIPYNRLLKRQLYNPLRLNGTSLPRTLNMPNPYLRGYEITPGTPPENVTKFINPALAWASGGIVSTLPDLGRFMRGYVPGDLFGSRIRRAQRSWVLGSSSPPGPGHNSAGLALFRYRTRCGTVFGHTGSFPGYRIFAASSGDGRSSVAYIANAQIVPGRGSVEVNRLIRKSQTEAVCQALG